VTVETVLLFALAAVAVTVLVRWVADRTGLPALLAPPQINLARHRSLL